MAFVSSNNSGSTNEVVNTAHRVSVAITQANAANPTNVNNLSDDSDHAEEGPTNCALMSYSSSSSDSELQSVEKDLNFIKRMSYVYVEKNNGLKMDIRVERYYEELRKKLEIVQKEKDGIQFKVDKFENASKSLKKIKESPIVRQLARNGLGYNTVPSPLTENFMPPKPNLSFTGLEEFTNEPVVIKPIVKNSEAKASEAKPKAVRKNNVAPIIEDWVSDDEEKDVSQPKIEKKTVRPSIAKIEFVKPKQQNKTARKTVLQVEKLSIDHLQNMVPRAVLMRSGLVSVNTPRKVNTTYLKTTVNAARPMSHLSKIAHSTVKRLIHKNTAFKNSNFNQRVNTVKDKNVNTFMGLRECFEALSICIGNG
ncbi:hypothetical protein Tco_0758274 [Tanacetum coccineum]